MNDIRPLLDSYVEQMDMQLARIEECLERIPADKLWQRPRAGVNSVGNLCLHLAGNESHYVGRGIGSTLR